MNLAARFDDTCNDNISKFDATAYAVLYEHYRWTIQNKRLFGRSRHTDYSFAKPIPHRSSFTTVLSGRCCLVRGDYWFPWLSATAPCRLTGTVTEAGIHRTAVKWYMPDGCTVLKLVADCNTANPLPKDKILLYASHYGSQPVVEEQSVATTNRKSTSPLSWNYWAHLLAPWRLQGNKLKLGLAFSECYSVPRPIAAMRFADDSSVEITPECLRLYATTGPQHFDESPWLSAISSYVRPALLADLVGNQAIFAGHIASRLSVGPLTKHADGKSGRSRRTAGALDVSEASTALLAPNKSQHWFHGRILNLATQMWFTLRSKNDVWAFAYTAGVDQTLQRDSPRWVGRTVWDVMSAVGARVNITSTWRLKLKLQDGIVAVHLGRLKDPATPSTLSSAAGRSTGGGGGDQSSSSLDSDTGSTKLSVDPMGSAGTTGPLEVALREQHDRHFDSYLGFTLWYKLGDVARNIEGVGSALRQPLGRGGESGEVLAADGASSNTNNTGSGRKIIFSVARLLLPNAVGIVVSC